MLKRIYIDNFRCLVNFDLPLQKASLLIGRNGTGKSTVFEVLYNLKEIIAGDKRVIDLFGERTRTRWDKRLLQTFEVEVQGPKGNYLYKLLIEHDENLKKARVKTEELSLNDNRIFLLDEKGKAHLFNDNFEERAVISFDWGRSGISALNPRNENKSLTWFKESFDRYILIKLEPYRMRSETDGDKRCLELGAENFASWYQSFMLQHQNFISDLKQKCSELFDHFDQFRFKPSGEQNIFEAGFSQKADEKPIFYRFGELSDGQRALIVLYSLLLAAKEANYTLFIDEPENYLALPELQPWLMELSEACEDTEMQAVIISHHPEFIDYLGPEHGIWLERHEGGPARNRKLSPTKDQVLKYSELIARGWENG